MNDEKSVMQEVYKTGEMAQELCSAMRGLESMIDNAKAEEFAKGVRAGMNAKVDDLAGKIVILKVEDPDALPRSVEQKLNHLFVDELQCKLIILREDSDLAALHDTHLKALGLQRIPSES